MLAWPLEDKYLDSRHCSHNIQSRAVHLGNKQLLSVYNMYLPT